MVVIAQTRLKQRGYDPGPIDGQFGPKTEAAVRAYQTDRHPPKPLALSAPFNLTIDGIIGPGTWFKLDPELVKRGSHNLTVRLAQELLKLAGNDPGPLDSDFGPKTEAAVKAFQQAHKDFDGHQLVADGIVGIKTWAALKS